MGMEIDWAGGPLADHSEVAEEILLLVGCHAHRRSDAPSIALPHIAVTLVSQDNMCRVALPCKLCHDLSHLVQDVELVLRHLKGTERDLDKSPHEVHTRSIESRLGIGNKAQVPEVCRLVPRTAHVLQHSLHRDSTVAFPAALNHSPVARIGPADNITPLAV